MQYDLMRHVLPDPIFVDWIAAPMALKPGPHVDDVKLLRNHAGDGD